LSDVVRIDKWLWAARFFKTRALAAEAIEGGKVHVNGRRAKRGKMVRVGDAVRIRKGPYTYHVSVSITAERRGSPRDAVTYYAETEASRKEREHLMEQHRAAATGFKPSKGRPTKRDRRLIEKLREEGS